VESEAGQGARFRVYLPASSGQPTVIPANTPAEQQRATVLVVDDESAVRNFIGAVLRRQGYSVLLAVDGRDALAACKQHAGRIDAAVVDVVMPIMGANDLMPVLKASFPEMRILLTSGYSESEARRLCAAYPEASFIQKPYTAQQISQAVSDLLGAGGNEKSRAGD
jgi:two-component system cell cycle sensor histidine kinase/response regulator CckA